MVSTEYPEFAALATASEVEFDKLKAAFADPQNLLTHLSLAELTRINESCGRFSHLAKELANACEVFNAFARGYMAAQQVTK